ncbi:hypothetical protein V1520DRAFT_351839 [Lipomyces starkeyi]
MEHGFLWSPLASEFIDASTEEAAYFGPHPEPVRDVDGDNDNNSGTKNATTDRSPITRQSTNEAQNPAEQRMKTEVTCYVQKLSARQQVVIMYTDGRILGHDRATVTIDCCGFTRGCTWSTNDICRSSVRNPAKHDHCFAPWSKRYAVLLDTSIRAKKYSHLAPETVDEGLRHMGVATEVGTVEVLVSPYTYVLMKKNSKGKENCAMKPLDAYDVFAFALKSAS